MDQSYRIDELFQQFFSGRLGFDRLRKDLRALFETAPEAASTFRERLADFVNVGRLPPDLALHLSQLAEAAGAGASAAPPAVAPRPAEPQDAPGVAMPLPTRSLVTGGTEEDLDPQIESRVEQLVLNAMLGDFKRYRSAKTAPAAPRVDRELDSSLSKYKGARMRREAERAEKGDGRAVPIAETEPERAAAEGEVLLGRFVLDREIGAGGMGRVFRAVDRRRLEAGNPDAYVAIKVIGPRFRDNPAALRALEAEARKAQALAHPNIVTVYDFERDGKTAFIVMELLRGKSLDQALGERQDRRMSLDELKPIAAGVGAALAHAHRNGVVHCDLKPGNVFVTEEGAVKVLDFGISTTARLGSFAAEALGAMTLSYASPEVIEGAPRDPRDDVYALACMIYIVLTGRHPFGRTPSTVARDQRMVPEAPAGLPRANWAALLRGLAFEREARTREADRLVAEVFRAGFWQRVFGR